MTRGKGYRDVRFTNRTNTDAKLIQFIEGDNETERTAARMLKALVPLMIEILDSRDPSKLGGFVRGVSNIVASMILSLPPSMREHISRTIVEDIERAIRVIQEHPDAQPRAE